MKKGFKVLSIFIISLIVILGVVGCQSEKNVDGDLPDIMAKLYKGIPDDKMPKVENIEVTKENMANYIGTDTLQDANILVSEPLIGSIAHSIVLVRVKDTNKVEDAKKLIKENINLQKWICVGIEDNEFIIKSKGDLIIAIVVKNKDIRETVSKNFDNL